MSLASFPKMKVSNLWRVKKQALPPQLEHSQFLRHGDLVDTKKQKRKWKQTCECESLALSILPATITQQERKNPDGKYQKSTSRISLPLLNTPNFIILTFQRLLMFNSSRLLFTAKHHPKTHVPEMLFLWKYGRCKTMDSKQQKEHNHASTKNINALSQAEWYALLHLWFQPVQGQRMLH